MDLIPFPSEGKLRRGVTTRKIPGTKITKNFHDIDEVIVPFLGYVNARGWGDEFQSKKILEEEPSRADDWLAMLQNWLVFGLLEDLMQRKLKFASLTSVEDDGNTYLDTRSLHGIMDEWSSGLLSDPGNTTLRSQWPRMEELLNDSGMALKYLCMQPRGALAQCFGSAAGNYFRALWIFRDVVDRHTRALLDSDKAKAEGLEPKGYTSWMGNHSYDRAPLLAAGWCAYTSHRISSSFTGSVVEYASRFSTETGFASTLQHPTCTLDSCALLKLPSSARSCIKHHPKLCSEPAAAAVGGTQTCENVKPTFTGLADALQNGTFPLIGLVETDAGPELEIIPYDESRPAIYVAISHVWAEGLGSCSELGLPICQIRRIFSILEPVFESMFCLPFDSDTPHLRKLMKVEIDNYVPVGYSVISVPRVLVWIDSLCVPGRPDLRRLAIRRMADVYRKAACTFVIDRCIGQLSVSDSIGEILMAVNTSSWMQRLWTLQEALLSDTVVFHVSDGFLSREDIFARIDTQDSLQMELVAGISRLVVPYSGPVSFNRLFTVLPWRSTNKPSDEVLALASICDLDVVKYLGLDGEERMIEFLMDMGRKGEISSEILFHRPHTRLTVDGFRWAPASLTGGIARHILPGGHPATVTRRGISSVFLCVMFSGPLPAWMPPVYSIVLDEDGVRDVYLGVEPGYDLKDLAREESSTPSHEDLGPDLLLLREWDRLFHGKMLMGALVRTRRELWAEATAETGIPVRFCGSVQLTVLEDKSCQDLDFPPDGFIRGTTDGGMVTGFNVLGKIITGKFIVS